MDYRSSPLTFLLILVTHSIGTGDAHPVSSHPFRANGVHAMCVEEETEKATRAGSK